jgi:protein-disulfide isomerase
LFPGRMPVVPLNALRPPSLSAKSPNGREPRAALHRLSIAQPQIRSREKSLKTAIRRFRLKAVAAVVLLFAVGTLCGAQSTSEVRGNDPRILSLEGTPSIGNKQTRFAIVEFGDYQCPFCGVYATQTFPQLVAAYVETGKVRYFFKDAPIEAIHPQAFKAAEAAHCAGAQGKYWTLHDRLFQNQRALMPNDLTAHAAAIGLDVDKFQHCLDGATFAARIRDDLQEAKKQGVRGTPQFFLGKLDPSGSTFQVVLTLSGAVPYSDFQQALDQLLSLQK